MIGEPIVLDETVKSLESRDAGPEERRRTITAVIQVLSDQIGYAVSSVNFFLTILLARHEGRAGTPVEPSEESTKFTLHPIWSLLPANYPFKPPNISI